MVLGKLPFKQQIGYGIVIDYGYEVNKRNSTEQSIKTEMVGAVSGSAVTGVIEGLSIVLPKFNGATKIITNAVASDVVSDKAKEKYDSKKKVEEKLK